MRRRDFERDRDLCLSFRRGVGERDGELLERERRSLYLAARWLRECGGGSAGTVEAAGDSVRSRDQRVRVRVSLLARVEGGGVDVPGGLEVGIGLLELDGDPLAALLTHDCEAASATLTTRHFKHYPKQSISQTPHVK